VSNGKRKTAIKLQDLFDDDKGRTILKRVLDFLKKAEVFCLQNATAAFCAPGKAPEVVEL
jgi:hypothetical protein